MIRDLNICSKLMYISLILCFKYNIQYKPSKKSICVVILLKTKVIKCCNLPILVLKVPKLVPKLITNVSI